VIVDVVGREEKRLAKKFMRRAVDDDVGEDVGSVMMEVEGDALLEWRSVDLEEGVVNASDHWGVMRTTRRRART